MKKKLGQVGFALTAVLVFVLALGLGAAFIVPRAVKWHHAAVVQYETDCLVSDLRLMQQMARTVVVYPIEETAEHRVHDAMPELEIRKNEHAYLILRRTYEGSLPKSSVLVRHSYPEALWLRPNITGRLQFGSNGGTATPTTIYIYYDDERENGKQIIIDSVGRIRVEGIDESAKR